MTLNRDKIGIIGGTFDPIHKGHLAMAEAAKKELKLDRILFVPTGVSYMKEGVSPNSVRYEMVSLALKDYPDYEISDIELKREGNTYTCDTVCELKEIFPKSELYFIIGTDTLFMLEKWKEFEYLFANLIFAVCSRGDENSNIGVKKAGELKVKYNAQIIFIPFTPVNISSTEIRAFYKEMSGENGIIHHKAVPEKVSEYIMKHGMYRT